LWQSYHRSKCAARYNREFVGIDTDKKDIDELAIPRIHDELRHKKHNSVLEMTLI